MKASGSIASNARFFIFFWKVSQTVMFFLILSSVRGSFRSIITHSNVIFIFVLFKFCLILQYISVLKSIDNAEFLKVLSSYSQNSSISSCLVSIFFSCCETSFSSFSISFLVLASSILDAVFSFYPSKSWNVNQSSIGPCIYYTDLRSSVKADKSCSLRMPFSSFFCAYLWLLRVLSNDVIQLSKRSMQFLGGL